MHEIRDLISTRKPGINELDLNMTEDKLGAVFPEQYKELFILVNNAEIGEWTLFPIKDPKNLNKTWDDVIRQNNEVHDERMSKEYISIGEDGSGDKICFKVINGKMTDEIYHWDHESTDFDEYASNLKEFIILNSEENDEDFDEE